MELEGDIRVPFSIRFGGGYTYLDAVNTDTGVSLTGRNPHQGSFRADWTPETLGLRANLRGAFYSSWVVSRSTTAAGTVDTVASRFALWDAAVSKTLVGGAELFGAIDNLTNSQDPEHRPALVGWRGTAILPAGDRPHLSWRHSMELEQVTRTKNSWRAAAVRVAAGVMAVTVAGAGLQAQPAQQDRTGTVILAHGGARNWNAQVAELAERVNTQMPAEVAFGMADGSTIQAAVYKLVARGATRIVAVPLFVSSHSSVFESSQYLLGARAEAPADLAMFAKMTGMSHGSPGDSEPKASGAAPDAEMASHHAAGDAHAGHSAPAPAVDGTKPVAATVPIRVGNALDHDPAVAAILTERAKAMSRNPSSEVVIIVAHGPSSDEGNALWVGDMEIVAKGIQASAPFARVESLTVRDDAPPEIRDAAASHLRDVVSKGTADGHRVLIVPLLLSYGGIEQGVRKRLEGLDYQMATQGLLPDDRLVQWVLDSARPTGASPATR